MAQYNDLPIPTPGKGVKGKINPNGKYVDLHYLDVGSYTIFKVTSQAEYLALNAMITYHLKRFGKKFTRRKDGDIVRVWRLS